MESSHVSLFAYQKFGVFLVLPKIPRKKIRIPLKKIGMHTFYDDYHNKLNISSGNSCWTLDIFRLKWTIEICDSLCSKLH